jgi:hypothetical protein
MLHMLELISHHVSYWPTMFGIPAVYLTCGRLRTTTCMQSRRHRIVPNNIDGVFQRRILQCVLSSIALANGPLVWKVIPLSVETNVF